MFLLAPLAWPADRRRTQQSMLVTRDRLSMEVPVPHFDRQSLHQIKDTEPHSWATMRADDGFPRAMENNRAENSHQPSRRRSSRPSRCAGTGQRLIRVRRRLIVDLHRQDRGDSTPHPPCDPAGSPARHSSGIDLHPGRMARAHPVAAVIKEITGARKTEVPGLRWSEVDPVRGILVLPPDRTKAGGKTGVRRSSGADGSGPGKCKKTQA